MPQTTFTANPNLHPDYLVNQLIICDVLIQRAQANFDHKRITELWAEKGQIINSIAENGINALFVYVKNYIKNKPQYTHNYESN